MDLGPEYRSIIGLPGGINHPQYRSSLAKIAKEYGFKLTPGKGSDADTLGKQIIYVYDSDRFPFYQAEIYHQFHVRFHHTIELAPQNNFLANVLVNVLILSCPHFFQIFRTTSSRYRMDPCTTAWRIVPWKMDVCN